MDERRLRLADYEVPPAPLPFPKDTRRDDAALPRSAARVLDAIEQMGHRIDDLTRELSCIGRIGPEDGGDDRPRAA
jgi:hypothetical protein